MKHGGSNVFIWGWFLSHGRGQLPIMETKNEWNHVFRYIKQEPLSVTDLKMNPNLMFQQKTILPNTLLAG